MTWPHCDISSASIPPKLVKLIVFFAAGCIGPGSSVLRIFLRILFRTWDIFTGNPEDLQFPHPIWDLLSPGANFQYPRKISTDVALIAPWAHPLSARRRASVR